MSNTKKNKISDIYDALPSESRKTLMDFAEFLFQRDGMVEAVATVKLDIPRPEKESVVAALKRLNQTYEMIEKKLIFHEASALMTEHVMQGRDVVEVIDELEVLFNEHYQDFLQENKD